MEYIDTFFDDWRDRGHRILRDSLRHALGERAPWAADCVEVVDSCDPVTVSALLGPDPRISAEQCVWGSLSPRQRPRQCPVRSFSDGRVLLPGLGFITGVPPDAALKLIQHDGNLAIHGHADAGFEPLQAIAPGVSATFYPHRHPPLRCFLELRGPHFDEVEISGPTAMNKAALARAWALIAEAWPAQSAELERDLRGVVVLRHPKVASMAALGIHGTVFFSTLGPEGPLYFVEELVHQTGHVTFSKVIMDWQGFLAVPYDTPMTLLTGDERDNRSFGDAFHGNYTLVRMLQTFAKLRALDLAPTLRHELRGRTALALLRLRLGLRQIEHPRLYTARGLVIHRRLAQAWTALDRELGALIDECDLDGQPYVFDPTLFVARNPD